MLSIRCIPPAVWIAAALCLLVSLWGGTRLYHPPAKVVVVPPPVPKSGISIIFYAYDTHGKELNARLEGPVSVVTPQSTGAKCILTNAEGFSTPLQFSYNGKSVEVPVRWLSAKEYRAWLDTELPAQLARLDASYNQEKWRGLVTHFKGVTVDNKYEYPIIIATGTGR